MSLNLLYANDAPGQYPDSWYAATARPLAPFDTLDGDRHADVCIIGGGYTGLTAALTLAEAGVDVVLLEAHRVGFGASGRNGGQLGSGQRQDQEVLEKMMGRDAARVLWQMGEDAKALVRDLINRHGIDCDLKPGVMCTASTAKDVQDLHDYADLLITQYGYDQIDSLDADACHVICPSPDYKGGYLDHGAAHLHPLNYALGLARAASSAGAQIYERTRVDRIEQGAKVRIETRTGTVTADNVILGCNGYLGGLEPQVAARVMPINNFIVATEPLGAAVTNVLARDVAVADSRFVVNYFRLSPDGRLLFGGGESYGYQFPADIAATVRKPMLEIFPHLEEARIDYAWGGTLAITMQRLPHLARVAPNILSGSGYSGHGVGSATQAGHLMAQAILGQADGFDTLSQLPTPPFPGGPRLRTPLLIMAMTWFAMRDRLGI